jgi:phosphoglycolate phosphatase-like HAD superfamily hydrolase
MANDKILNADLIVFDKDGTLIDFHAMWGQWVMMLAGRLKKTTGCPIDLPLFKHLGFNITTGEVITNGHLALSPITKIRAEIANVLQTTSLTTDETEMALNAAWYIPDPVALAKPLANLQTLFTTLQAQNTKIAIATSDDRLPTQATLAKLGLSTLVDALICADDCLNENLLLKPAPDMIINLCHKLNISPLKTVVVGDNIVDLQMGQAAKVGLVVGVLSGLCSAEMLKPYADVILPSVAHLVGKGRGQKVEGRIFNC